MDMMTTTEALTTKTPREIDELWAAAQEPCQVIGAKLDETMRSIRRFAGRRLPQYLADRELAQRAELAEAQTALAPFQAEWERRAALRGERRGWTRYFRCTADGGHIHELPCHTLTPGRSTVVLVPELTEMSPAEMIERVGHHACTHCFPQAPAAPAWARTMAAEAADLAAVKAEKSRIAADKAAALAAKGITTPDGKTLLDSGRYPIRTLRTARIALVDDLMYAAWSEVEARKAELTGHARYLAVAIAAKTGENVETLLADGAVKARKRLARK